MALIRICLYLQFIALNGALATSDGHKVWEYLFTNGSYNSDVRPVKQWSTPTVINVSFAIIAIIDFNEVKQTIVLTSKLTLAWEDEYLTWNPAEFGNISHIHVAQDRLWKPYILLENSVSKQSELGTQSLQVILGNDGKVEWHPVEVFQATCAADVRKFPFDTQKCSMVFEALGYAGSELQMKSVQDHIEFHGNGISVGWTVTETHMEAVEEDGNIHILCSLTLRRNPTYFTLNIFLPIVVLSFLNQCVFILPVQSGEKASFVITVFLSLAVFLTIVSSNLPENSNSVSILNGYVFISTLMSVIIAILTIIQIRLFHRDPEIPVSPCLSKIAIMCSSKPRLLNCGEPKKGKNGKMEDNITKVEPFEHDILEKPEFLETSSKNQRTVTWPQVVKAFDNIFLVVFLTVNIVMTTLIFILAVRQEDVKLEEHH